MSPLEGECDERLFFDCTPSYFDTFRFKYNFIPERVRAVFKGAIKVVVVLRDPVDRFHR